MPGLRSVVDLIRGRSGAIGALVILVVVLLTSLLDWNLWGGDTRVSVATPAAGPLGESEQSKSGGLGSSSERRTTIAGRGPSVPKRSALEQSTGNENEAPAALAPNWSKPRTWFGRIVPPESLGLARVPGLEGLEAGVAFWRRSSVRPFPSREAWIAQGVSQAGGYFELNLPSIDKLRAENAEFLIEAPKVGLAVVPLNWLATSRETAQVIRLEHFARIIVHVQRPEGGPLQGVTAELSGRFDVKGAQTWFSNAKKHWKTRRFWTATTDAQGAARFSIGPTERELSLRLVYNEVEVWNEEGNVFARPGETVHLGIRLQAPFQGRVYGVVKTYAGEPCEGYEIRAGILPGLPHRDDLLAPVPTSSFSHQTQTDEDGRYAMDLPLRGLVTVAAQPASHANQQRRRTVRLKDSVPEREVNFVVSANRSVAGNLTGPEGAPVPGANIILVRPAFAQAQSTPLATLRTTTDNQGRFRFKRVPGGPLLSDVVSDAGVLRAPVPVHNGRLELQLEASGTVPFHITPSPGAVQGRKVVVQLFDSQGALARQKDAKVGIAQQISGIPSGHYTMIVHDTKGSPRPLFGRLDDVFVPALGEAPECSIALEPSPLSHLRLVRRSRHGTSKITLRNDRTMETQSVDLGRMGSVELQLTAGLWELHWLSKNGIERTRSIVLGVEEERELEDAFD